MNPTRAPRPIATLAMYPFDDLRSAYDALWAEVHRLVPWSPAELDWNLDVHDSWLEPALAVAQTCGWPLVTGLRDRVTPLGSFRLTHDLADGYSYRTLIVATDDRPIEEFAGAVAAVNSVDSLSGWISLIAAVHGPGASWEGTVVWSGAHVASLAALQRGEATVASIDSVSWQHVLRVQPSLLDGLHIVGYGPLVPSLPLITAPGRSSDEVSELRAALASASKTADPVLMIDGFQPLDFDDYLPLLDLGTQAPEDDQHD
jgi:ABC-type phosphate/phosphonate transport system substrate-binding protein